ncbi:MAG: tyrosine-type recombinase/integrase [Clostridium sp.]|uniref:tyrosine-type recombinase/integrase n=1 Tax=Clostridium sp. TaxID=1506 RepID=UPI0025BFDFED|nr:tyrosine-type recombinase/integrase [Clostridium sp.]MCE5221035.1 tyrosine-type recombinase/integrase [Clostridium sp.]
MLLKELLKEFILELEIRNYSKRTLKSYRNNNLLMFTYLEKEYEIIEIEEVKTPHIKSYIKFLERQGRKTTYINGIIKCFRAFFKYVVDEEIVSLNPMARVSWIREGKVIINTFNDEEVSKLINVFKGRDYIDIRNKTIMAFLLDTGVRNLELCNIRNIDVNENSLTIKQGKGRKDRRVALSPYLRKIIIRYIRCKESYFKNRIMDENTPFFLSYRFKPLTVEAVERVVRLCGKMANIRKEIRCSPHTCRHYFAQAQLRNGLDIYSLSRLLGHEDIAITKRYLQGLEDENIIEMSVKTSPLMNLNKMKI